MNIQDKLNILLKRKFFCDKTSVIQAKNISNMAPGGKSYARFPEIKLNSVPSLHVINVLCRAFGKNVKINNDLSRVELYIFIVEGGYVESVYHYYKINHSIEYLSFIEKIKFDRIFILHNELRPRFFFVLSIRTPSLSHKLDISIKKVVETIVHQAHILGLKVKSSNVANKECSDILELDKMRESLALIIAFY